jgi:hypothetical protein
MATTTNYGWTTPDDTALVKDGAAAIRTLGSSVDTTTKNLNPETTLGDIAYRSSTANVKTRLALGTANQVLAVNSGATAPEWKTLVSGGMTLLSTTTLSGAATTVSSIDQTYKNLEIVIVDAYATGANNDYIEFNGDTGNNYGYRWFDPASDTGSGVKCYLGVMGTSQGYYAGTYINISIPRYSETEYKKISYSQVKSTVQQIGNNAWNNTAAITSFTIGVTNAQTMSGGTMYIYGVK